MKKIKAIWIVTLAIFFVSCGQTESKIEDDVPQNASAGWKENYAYTLGVQAYLNLFPWVYLPEIKYEWVGREKPDEWQGFDMPLNHFYHKKTLVDAKTYRDGGSPNNDTQYSIAILDLRNGPVVISHPNLDERYFTFEIASFTSDNFAYIGTRTTGNEAGEFLIAGPNWDGEVPEGLQLPAQSNGTKAMNLPAVSPTPFVIVIGRTAVKGLEELETVNGIMEKYHIQPLANWLSGEEFVASDRAVWKPFNREEDELADWKTINKALAENPPLNQNVNIFKLYENIGIGAGIDVEDMDTSIKKGLARAAVDGRDLVFKAGQGGGFGKMINGWSFPPSTMGSAGYFNDLFTRSVIQCAGGIISNDPQEGMYPNAFFDKKGATLDGKYKYTLTFEKDKLPEVSQFWSLTLYDETYNLVDNPIDKYNISSLRDKFKFSEDGKLIFYIQNESPGEDKQDNWLPAPASGMFYLVLRAYGPGAEFLDQTWEIPGLERVVDN